jgi:UDP:flavonoid glycosyltransferase YjiC (YdhE family)
LSFRKSTDIVFTHWKGGTLNHMLLRVGILPHADLPHLLPSFRICRELIKQGHSVHILGSDAFAIFRGHSSAWGEQLDIFHLRGHELVHNDPQRNFADWLIQQIHELKLDVMILDAVWQGLAQACQASGRLKCVVVHHAGFPDFRNRDMPPWCFVHPGHPSDYRAQARAFIESHEKTAGLGIRGIMLNVRDLWRGASAAVGEFEPGCSEFASLPAVHAVSLCPALEFPDERGRTEYFGNLLPSPGDIDWRPLPPQVADVSHPLIACIFGTKGLQTPDQHQWLSSLASQLGRSFLTHQIVVVIPGSEKIESPNGSNPKNVLVQPWIPLWELLSTRKAPRVLVTTPGVGALREATASATPIVAIPRRLDQFGAAARVEFFGIGAALVSPDLPEPDLVVQRVREVFDNTEIHARSQRLRDDLAAFDATQPLKRFMHNPAIGATQPSNPTP